jgi:hypothetical protein
LVYVVKVIINYQLSIITGEKKNFFFEALKQVSVFYFFVETIVDNKNQLHFVIGYRI